MKNTIWEKRVPEIMIIVFIIIGIAITTFLVKTGVIFITKASPSQVPRNVRITNISDTSFTVSYATEENTTGSINFGTDKNFGQVGLDDRDQQNGKLTPHKLHNITVKNLNPKTSYFFEILSGEDKYLNNDIPFEAPTAQVIQSNPPSREPIIGNVVLPDGSKPNEAIIYVTVENAQVVSNLINDDGSFILPLNSLRNSNFLDYFKFDRDIKVKMIIIGNSLQSNIEFFSKQISPIPTITLSYDYDFTTSNTPVASRSAALEGFSSLSVKSSSAGATQTPQILTPKKDQGFTDQQPQFKGTAIPNEKVQIIIHSSEEIKTQVTADTLGNWTYRPETTLSPGQHTISIATKDPSGILKTITQSFTVYAAGTQINGVIPSTTPTPTLIPTSIPTPTAIALPSLTPTIIITKPPISPTPMVKIAPTGNSSIVIVGIFAALISLLAGGLFFLRRQSFL